MRDDILQLLEQKTTAARDAAQVALARHRECRDLLRRASDECAPPLSMQDLPSSPPARVETMTFLEAIAFPRQLEEECGQGLRKALAAFETLLKEHRAAEHGAQVSLARYRQQMKAALATVELEVNEDIRDARRPYSTILSKVRVAINIALIPVALFIWFKSFPVWGRLLGSPGLARDAGFMDFVGILVVQLLRLGIILLGWVPVWLSVVVGVNSIHHRLQEGAARDAAQAGKSRREATMAQWGPGEQAAERSLAQASTTLQVVKQWHASLNSYLADLVGRRSHTCGSTSFSKVDGMLMPGGTTPRQ